MCKRPWVASITEGNPAGGALTHFREAQGLGRGLARHACSTLACAPCKTLGAWRENRIRQAARTSPWKVPGGGDRGCSKEPKGRQETKATEVRT